MISRSTERGRLGFGIERDDQAGPFRCRHGEHESCRPKALGAVRARPDLRADRRWPSTRVLGSHPARPTRTTRLPRRRLPRRSSRQVSPSLTRAEAPIVCLNSVGLPLQLLRLQVQEPAVPTGLTIGVRAALRRPIPIVGGRTWRSIALGLQSGAERARPERMLRSGQRWLGCLASRLTSGHGDLAPTVKKRSPSASRNWTTGGGCCTRCPLVPVTATSITSSRPGGVFTVNAKNHPDASVWVSGETFMVNGRRVPYVRNSRHEAQRATQLLTDAVGFPVFVTGCSPSTAQRAASPSSSNPQVTSQFSPAASSPGGFAGGRRALRVIKSRRSTRTPAAPPAGPPRQSGKVTGKRRNIPMQPDHVMARTAAAVGIPAAADTADVGNGTDRRERVSGG